MLQLKELQHAQPSVFSNSLRSPLYKIKDKKFFTNRNIFNIINFFVLKLFAFHIIISSNNFFNVIPQQIHLFHF